MRFAFALLIGFLLTSSVHAADNELTDQEKKVGWLLLFDGETLNGWMTSAEKPSKRPVEEHAINPHKCGHYMMTHEKQWGDFSLALDYKLTKNCNNDEACISREMSKLEKQLTAEGKLPHVSWERIVDHIDHAVKLVGADHVGLGSDFDGANMPDGLEDCSKLPKITEALLRKGYSEGDVRKILGENTLRVMEQAERVSRQLQSQE